MNKVFSILLVLLMIPAIVLAGGDRFVKKINFTDDYQIEIVFAGAVSPAWAQPANIIVNEESDPDILLAIKSVKLNQNGTVLTLVMKDKINQVITHQVILKAIISKGQSQGTAVLNVKKPYLGQLLGVLIGAMLVYNYVFVKYLGLCVFLGVTQKKSTAVGMGITFTIVIVFATMLSWGLYQYVLKPFQLGFLQIIIFIGMVSLTVQAVDTILRKVNPVLFREFGVYLVLVISSCLILAVPLIMAANEYDMFESFMLALGAGLGFFIALFLMASVRERLELADIPPSYRGLPIVFILSGLFALAFMGFSGMSIF